MMQLPVLLYAASQGASLVFLGIGGKNERIV